MKIPIAIVDDRSQNRLSLAERINVSDDIGCKIYCSKWQRFP
jgi:hypothetical protein